MSRKRVSLVFLVPKLKDEEIEKRALAYKHATSVLCKHFLLQLRFKTLFRQFFEKRQENVTKKGHFLIFICALLD